MAFTRPCSRLRPRPPWETCSGFSTIICRTPGWHFCCSLPIFWPPSGIWCGAPSAPTPWRWPAAEVGVVFCTVVLVTGPLVGASGVGHLVDVGCAAHQHARALADLRQLPGAAALRHGRADTGAGGGAGDLRICRRADRLSLDPLFPHAASAAGDRRRRRLGARPAHVDRRALEPGRLSRRSRCCWCGCDTVWRWRRRLWKKLMSTARSRRRRSSRNREPPPRAIRPSLTRRSTYPSEPQMGAPGNPS